MSFDNKYVWLVVIVVVIALGYMYYNSGNEHFDNEASLGYVPNSKVVNDNVPLIDPKTSTIMDGPGFERSEGDNVQGMDAPTIPQSIPSNYYFLQDGSGNNGLSIMNNMCSKSCCSAQWPLPFRLEDNKYICANKDKFVPTNYTCMDSFNNVGCSCIDKNQFRHLETRGTNAPWSF